jgi:protein-tyrosine phosphatase
MFSVLFVCMGNICRSPTAEGVFRHLLQENNLGRTVVADSAGTHAYHIGEAPDPRAQQAAARRGYDLSGLRARKIVAQDMDHFDLILAMDQKCLEAIRLVCPPERFERLGLFMAYAQRFDENEVPDPYYGSGDGFERVLDMIEDASTVLLFFVKERTAFRS